MPMRSRSRTEMFRVTTGSLDLYRRRHTGRSPRRVICSQIHGVKNVEIDGCMEALHLCEAVDLVQVVDDVSIVLHINLWSSGTAHALSVRAIDRDGHRASAE